MAIRQAVQLFVLALAGATLAGCVQHTVTERSASLGVSPQAPGAGAAAAPGIGRAPPARGRSVEEAHPVRRQAGRRQTGGH